MAVQRAVLIAALDIMVLLIKNIVASDVDLARTVMKKQPLILMSVKIVLQENMAMPLQQPRKVRACLAEEASTILTKDLADLLPVNYVQQAEPP